MVGSLPGCCARAASGEHAAAPPSSVMNSRRLIGAYPTPKIMDLQYNRSLVKCVATKSGA